MRMTDIIMKKRRGLPIDTREIEFFVRGYAEGEIPDYQAAALLMAICFRGMDERETADLTLAMARSGDEIDLSAIEGVKVDKHSTGGVGDKISLIAGPLAASVGIPVAKMSGRGLGHTGGTLDKLESIPGFRTSLSKEAFIDQVNRLKLALTGQTADLAPADKKLYALRDVTATVDSIPLIASSVMSKKIASGADRIVLDVKTGSGAFMKSREEARKLARAMVDIGSRLGRKTVAVITDMSQPLGREVGNANEVREAIEVLRGGGPDDVREVALTIASHMAALGGAFASWKDARPALEAALADGRALEKFRQFVAAQGGDTAVADDPGRLPRASRTVPVRAAADGTVAAIDAESIGRAAMMLGAGRRTKDDDIDHGAGITVIRKIGDDVRQGDTLCELHTNAPDTAAAEALVLEAYTIGSGRVERPPAVYEVVE